ncbi:uncharacterized protein B0I36DRAFT_117540 [Microdochium trichocladiopsis]|uniref:Uncharacterized protein n=1 Tax=Microdochium trichocladiopsis TaxID=1682393 RepID=A0A9P9BQL4_9PEZI|nr:uncharacterized protein B0I36DRAFT_117540 [Microdochium trichocladiopsis]KAH7031008.1 hypothetical protein B0I36DRAFT_117540 [Microdochium trichocladiopsis]
MQGGCRDLRSQCAGLVLSWACSQPCKLGPQRQDWHGPSIYPVMPCVGAAGWYGTSRAANTHGLWCCEGVSLEKSGHGAASLVPRQPTPASQRRSPPLRSGLCLRSCAGVGKRSSVSTSTNAASVRTTASVRRPRTPCTRSLQLETDDRVADVPDTSKLGRNHEHCFNSFVIAHIKLATAISLSYG